MGLELLFPGFAASPVTPRPDRLAPPAAERAEFLLRRRRDDRIMAAALTTPNHERLRPRKPGEYPVSGVRRNKARERTKKPACLMAGCEPPAPAGRGRWHHKPNHEANMHSLSQAAPVACGDRRLGRRAVFHVILALSLALWAVVILAVIWVTR
jgi:hypothetical protein